MYVVIIILTVIVALLLIGIVLIQKSKGGGLSAQFGGAGAVMGVRQTNTFLEKATWVLAAAIVVLSVLSAFTMPKAASGVEMRTKAAAPAPAATAPAGGFSTDAVEIPAAETEAAAEVAAEAAAETGASAE